MGCSKGSQGSGILFLISWSDYAKNEGKFYEKELLLLRSIIGTVRYLASPFSIRTVNSFITCSVLDYYAYFSLFSSMSSSESSSFF